jgi:hypothetical protein
MIPQLNKVAYVIRSLKNLIFLESIKMVSFMTVHSIIAYGIIIWGISTYSNIIFKIQKRIIRTIMNVGNKDCCRNLYKILHILPLQAQYKFSKLIFLFTNKELFKPTQKFIVLIQDFSMIYVFLRQNWQYFRKECGILVPESKTISHPLSNNLHMKLLNLKLL